MSTISKFKTPYLLTGVAISLWAVACTPTKPGAHVELIDKGGQTVYAAGAAGPGVSKTVACKHAVNRSVAAIAQRFAYENDDIADDVADEVGVSDGAAFMERFAKADALSAAVLDVQFDPSKHLCMAMVSWKPPVFVKDAVLKFAQQLKQQELGGSSSVEGDAAAEGAIARAQPVQTAPMNNQPAPHVATAPPPPAPVAAAPAPQPALPINKCQHEHRHLQKVLASSQKSVSDFQECLRRTSNDETICHRYKLYVEDAGKKEAKAGDSLSKCLNVSLASSVRMALSRSLPGHAAVSVENRGDGTLILWTYSPVQHTAFVFEVSPTGQGLQGGALAANQVAWVKGRLGL